MSEDTETPTQQRVAQPAFPFTQYGILPHDAPNQGMNIQVLLADGMAFTLFVNEEGMNQIAGKWLETRPARHRYLEEQRAIQEDAARVVANGNAVVQEPVAIHSKRKGK